MDQQLANEMKEELQRWRNGEEGYDVDQKGFIASPGKFEGEPYYIPYYWACSLGGAADREDNEGNIIFELTGEDHFAVPEFEGKERLILCVLEDGFVTHRLE